MGSLPYAEFVDAAANFINAHGRAEAARKQKAKNAPTYVNEERAAARRLISAAQLVDAVLRDRETPPPSDNDAPPPEEVSHG